MKVLFFIFLALIPFQVSISPFESFDLSFGRVLLLILFLWWGIYSLKQKKILLPKGLSHSLLWGFFLVAVFSLFIAQEKSFALRKLAFLLNYFPLFFVLPSLVSSQKDYQRFFDVLLFSGFAASLLGLGQFLAQFIVGYERVFNFFASLAPLIYGQNFGEAILLHNSWLVNIGGKTFFRAIALFPDPHIFGFYLAFIIPAAIFSQKRAHKLIGGISFLALLFTFSRAAYVGTIIAFFLYGFIICIKDKKRALFSLTVSLALMGSVIFTPIGNRFLSSFDLSEGSVAARLEIWSQAWDVIKERPFFGVGLGNYPLAIEPIANYRTPASAHNLYLDIATELGLAGLFAWILLMVHTLYSLLLKAKSHWIRARFARSFLADSKCAPLFISLLWFSLQAFFDTPLFSVHILPLLVIFLSMSNASFHKVTE